MKTTIKKIGVWLYDNFPLILSIVWGSLCLLNTWIGTKESRAEAYYQMLLCITWLILSMSLQDSNDTNA